MNDLDFIRRCFEGDKVAWVEFVDRYSHLVYKYINSVLAARGFYPARDNVNDLFQEIFLSLIKDNFKKLRSFKARNKCSFASWLRQVVINAAIDYTRRLKPTVSLEEEIADDFSLKDILSDDSPSPSETMNQDEVSKQLKDCIGGLNLDDRYFLELHINRGLRLEELAEYLKLSRGAFDMRKTRIIKKLRDCFRSKGFMLDF
jgi:RNA polymerase sigma factor (sigma-70 family)